MRCGSPLAQVEPTLSLVVRQVFCALFVCVAAFAGLATGALADLRIVAPSPPGSGWDQLAQALREIAAETGGEPIQVVNVPGTGGTVGLSRFLTDPGEDLLVTGLTMLDATLVQRSPVTLDAVTPIARLSIEPFAVVVPAASPILSLSDLKSAFWQDAAKLTWAGGPAGSIDHVAAALFARAVGIDPLRLNYVPFLATADAVAALAEGRVSCAILTAGETVAEIGAGRIRVLGVTAPGSDLRTPDASVAVPTLVESGIPLDLANWRGLLGKPGLPRAEVERLSAMAARTTNLPGWRALLDRKGWQPGYLGPEAFTAFLRAEQARMKDVLKATGVLKRPD